VYATFVYAPKMNVYSPSNCSKPLWISNEK